MCELDAQQRIAGLLALPHCSSMQDWDLEVADPNRVADFIRLYEQDRTLNDIERQELMKLIISSYDAFLQQVPAHTNECHIERSLTAILQRDLALHSETIQYWLGESDEDVFDVRTFLIKVVQPDL